MARNISGHGMTTPMENEPENSSFRLSTEWEQRKLPLPLTRPTSTPSARACPFCIGRVLLLSDERCTFSNNASKDCKPLPVPCLYENVFRALYASGYRKADTSQYWRYPN